MHLCMAVVQFVAFFMRERGATLDPKDDAVAHEAPP
jgi:hypothetical protein